MRRAVSSSFIAPTAVAAALLLAPRGTVSQQSDPSPHRSATVTVQGVRIHYLDWGGTGPALVFIPGFGNSAHVFDDFAPRLVDRCRVVAITRVGFGESGQPEGEGYELASRVEQIRAVLDTLGLERAVLAGHSLGGDEITAFAAEYPARTAGLVYLDAAYDHVKAFGWEESLAPFLAGMPQPEAADLATASAFQAYFERARGVRMPIGEVLAISRFDSTGALVGSRTPPRVQQALLQATRPLDYSGVEAPALALYSDWESAADIFRWLSADSAANAAATATLQESVASGQASERERFAREVPGARVVTFRAHHYQFLSDPDRTERLIREFLDGLSDHSGARGHP